MFSVAIIGCGKIAGLNCRRDNRKYCSNTHGGAFFFNKNFRIKYAIDIDKKRAEAFANIWNVPNVTADFQEFLDKDPIDVASVCTPDHTHYDVVAKLLSLRCPPKVIFAEKPVCVLRPELAELKNRIKGIKTDIVVNHSRRFDKSHRRLKTSLRNLGRLLKVDARYYGGLIHNGVHMIDLIRMLTDEELILRDSCFRNMNKRAKGDYDIDADFSLSRSGAAVSLRCFPEDVCQIFEAEFFLTKGRIRLTDFGHVIEVEKIRTNRYGEKELVLAFRKNYALNMPMNDAVKEIHKILVNKPTFAKKELGLNNAGIAMSVIWQSIDRAKEGSYAKKISN